MGGVVTNLNQDLSEISKGNGKRAGVGGGPGDGVVGRRQEGEELVEEAAGFSAGIVPFDNIEPGFAGELFGFPNGGEFVEFGVDEVEGGEMGEQAIFFAQISPVTAQMPSESSLNVC